MGRSPASEDDGPSGGETTADAAAAADDVPLHPSLYYAAAFLAVATLLQVAASSGGEAGPFDRFASFLMPGLFSLGPRAAWNGDSARGGDGLVCPPDGWADEAFAARDPPAAGLYSTVHDPRNIVPKPSLFPHCALRRWVRMEEEHECPEGEEYVTILYPQTIAKRAVEGKIPKIMHLSSSTNCLPSATVEALRDLIREHNSQAYTIYVHSRATMDNFLFQREWTIFPQVKEAVLCGRGKLKAVAHAAIRELNVANNTRLHYEIADRIAQGLERDVWRYMILWEYGGVAMDVAALRAVLRGEGEGRAPAAPPPTGATNATTAVARGGRAALGRLMRQWSAEGSGALLYFVNNADRQRLPYNERVPLTDVVGAAPHHPLFYYGAKVAFRIAVWDNEKSITDVGRTTKIPPIREALGLLNSGWKNIKTGEVMEIKNENKHSIHFVDGDVVLPPALTSPRTTPWRSIFAAFQTSRAEAAPSEESINAAMRSAAGQQKYIGVPQGLFSCMEYTLDMYLQTTTVRKT